MKKYPAALVAFFQQAFKHITLGDERTLMEWDFSDVHRCFFDEVPQTRLEQTLALVQNSHAPPYQRMRQIELLTTRARDHEGRWQDVQPYYLEAFHTGITFMTPAAFIFYSAAIINRVYDGNLPVDGLPVDYLLTRLAEEAGRTEFNTQLSTDMCTALLIFLEVIDTDYDGPRFEKIVTALGGTYPQQPRHDHFMNAIFAKEFERAEMIAQQMQELGVIDLGGTDCRYPESPLDEYIVWGEYEALEILLRHGASLNYEPWQGSPVETLIEITESPSDRDPFKYLDLFVQYGIDWELRCVNRWTALILATVRGRQELVQYLVEHGANINAQDDVDNYETALQQAIYFKQFGIALYLLDHGADPYIKNNNGRNLMVRLGLNHRDELRAYVEQGMALGEVE